MAAQLPYPGRIVKAGDSDASLIRLIQQRLIDLRCGEPPLVVNGIFDVVMLRSVKLFQSRALDTRNVPLKVDGLIGSITWAALFGEAAPVTEQPTELVQAAINQAISQVGVTENPALSNSGPEVNRYLASVNLGPGFAWCAAFLYHCFQESATSLGVTNPVIRTAGVLDHWAKAGTANNPRIKRIKKDATINNPTLVKAGHIFITSFGGGLGHTGLITSVVNGMINTVEGNTYSQGAIVHDGIGVFRRTRKVVDINLGFVEYS